MELRGRECDRNRCLEILADAAKFSRNHLHNDVTSRIAEEAYQPVVDLHSATLLEGNGNPCSTKYICSATSS